MKKVVLALILGLAICFTLTACGNSNGKDAQPADLTGQWKQVNSNSDKLCQAAIIKDDTIEIYWVNQSDNSYSLYWSGTFVAPETVEEPYSWESTNNHDKTSTALLASNDDTKTITYKNGQLSYSASALGTTQVVNLERADGVLDAVA